MKRSQSLRRGKPLRRTAFKPCGSALPRKAKPKPVRDNEPSKAVKDAVLIRDNLHCQRCGKDLAATRSPYSRQHLLPRGRGGQNTMRNLALVCGSATTPDMCHDDIEHQARRRATAEGWLVPNGIDPEDWAVLRFGQYWAKPGDDEWVEAEPHPLQVEMLAALNGAARSQGAA
ncbi:hypothetical protein JOF41_007307 [Saccharothrix coeruleofusca]|uniref:HNH endonuclease n=1 Tax=Saccharothrix coeruleofusca TaxID=33919 RepID=UPI001AEABE35|nr:HNH endonuclease [Saccharothrix coeruleofusca]MBP2341053.1 hypothetical protein [Saccharothrix coeruleofusca]